MKRPLLILAWLCACATARAADSAAPLGLPEAMQMAEKRSVNAVVADERVKQAVERYHQALSLFAPRLTVEAKQERRTAELSSMGIELPGASGETIGPFNSFDGRFRATQLLFDLGAIERLFLVRDGKRLAEAQYEKARQDTLALVAALYLDAQRATERTRLAAAYEKREDLRLRLAHRKFRSGVATLPDLRRVKASQKKSRAYRWGARNAEIEKRQTLFSAIGLPADSTRALDAARTQRAIGMASNDEIRSLAERSPDVATARAALAQRESDLRVQWAEFLPKVEAYGDYGLSGATPDDSKDTYTVGVKASVPIFEGGMRVFKISEAESRRREVTAQLSDAEDQARIKAAASAREAVRALELLKASDLELLAAAQNARVVESRYAGGSASLWQRIDTLTESALADDSRSEAAASYLLSQVAFARSIGKMDDFVKNYGAAL